MEVQRHLENVDLSRTEFTCSSRAEFSASTEIEAKRVSVYNLGINERGAIYELNGRSFDRAAFSRLKFGSYTDARNYARQIAEALDIAALGPDLVITSAAHSYISTAASLLAQHVQVALNEATKSLIPYAKMHTNPIDENFASLSPEQRKDYLRRSQYHIDRELVINRHVLVVDDIRVTGGHELSIHKILEGSALRVTYAYVAQLEAGCRTEYENLLNNTAVRNLEELASILRAEGATVTEKSCKFVVGDIIGPHDETELGRFLRSLSTVNLLELHGALVANGYIFNSRYAKEVEMISNEIRRR